MRRLRSWVLRVAGLVDRGRRDRELADEIESHLQMHTEENMRRGMTPEAARRASVLKLGNASCWQVWLRASCSPGSWARRCRPSWSGHADRLAFVSPDGPGARDRRGAGRARARPTGHGYRSDDGTSARIGRLLRPRRPLQVVVKAEPSGVSSLPQTATVTRHNCASARMVCRDLLVAYQLH